MRLLRLVPTLLVLATAILLVPGRLGSPSFISAAPQNGANQSNPLGFSISDLSQSVSPCADFYDYACSTWMKNNPIPSDQSRWGRFNELAERNREVLHQILEEAAKPVPDRDPVEQKIGDYYAACMDETAVDAKGLQPVKPELDRIAALQDKAALVDEIAHLQGEGVRVLFRFSSEQDAKDSTQEIAGVDQGGITLPDRDYYLKTDPHSVELRQQYQAHIAKMMELAGEPAGKAAADAATVMKIETALAQASLDRVSRRDPNRVYHKMTTQDLVALDPGFAWPRFFTLVSAPPIENLNVAVPDFFKRLNGLLDSTRLEDWKAYLRWHLLHSAAPMLSTPFVNSDFAFFGKTLTGAKEIQARWKRCVQSTDRALGFALGQKYVAKNFSPQAKADTLHMVESIEKAMAEDIRQLDWMTPATKKAALEKLGKVTNKIGYPDKWRDYSSVNIVRDDALGNEERAAGFEFHRRVNKIGKPVDRTEWVMTPPTVNAYYSPQTNSINFPAGILQAPFYDPRRDFAMNFGGIGAVVGHELTHGFDDQGRKFDGDGNLRDWWTKDDAEAFEKRADCIVSEYSSFVPVADVHLNGKLTLGENTADNGGVRLAHMALLNRLRSNPAENTKVEGFTPEQRLFLGYARVWAQNQTNQVARMLAAIDPHSPGRYRVDGVVRNLPEFRNTWGCKVDQPMASPHSCRVW